MYLNLMDIQKNGLIEKKEAIKRLRYEKTNLQICIRNQEILEQKFQFVESEEI